MQRPSLFVYRMNLFYIRTFSVLYNIHCFCKGAYSVSLRNPLVLYQGLLCSFTASTVSVSGLLLAFTLHTGSVSGPSPFVNSIHWFCIMAFSIRLRYLLVKDVLHSFTVPTGSVSGPILLFSVSTGLLSSLQDPSVLSQIRFCSFTVPIGSVIEPSLFEYSVKWFCIRTLSVRLQYSLLLYQDLSPDPSLSQFTVSTGAVCGMKVLITLCGHVF